MASNPFNIPLRIRYGETDQMGVVHHASFLGYLEDARTLFMEELGHSYAELESAGIGLPVRSLAISYRSSARFGEQLTPLYGSRRSLGPPSPLAMRSGASLMTASS